MRHAKSGKKLGRDSAHRKALYSNLAGALITHGRIQTTEAKAKAVKPYAEKLITLGKRGDLHARRQALAKLWSETRWRGNDVMITTGSSTAMPIPDACVDYVFVDPPFGANIPYADLAMLVEEWHRVLTNSTEEATEDSMKGRGLDEYADLMARCFEEFFRVLKPG